MILLHVATVTGAEVGELAQLRVRVRARLAAVPIDFQNYVDSTSQLLCEYPLP